MENNKEREAKEYVAEIMRQRAVNAPKPGGPRRAGPRPALLAVLAVLLVSLIAWNLTAGRRQPVVVSPDKVEASARLTVYLVAQAIETYRDTTRTLPRNLEDLGVDGVGITYTPDRSTYTLAVEIGGTQLTYRSGESLEPYRAAAEVLLGGLR
jgi:mRNA-degrading endonuclease toxin of MazEF toxin-antitoxin module